jgi:hypothetical protein
MNRDFRDDGVPCTCVVLLLFLACLVLELSVLAVVIWLVLR